MLLLFKENNKNKLYIIL